jgi:hypothetical protein
MNKKAIFGTLGVLSLVACIAMYVIGGNNANLTELRDYWWIPLPLAAIFLLLAAKTK